MKMEGVLSMSNISGGIYFGANNGCLRNMGMMFLNNDHRKYYDNNKFRSRVAVNCCNKDNMVVIEKGNTKLDYDDKKMNKKQKMMMKKRSKLLKGLSRDIVAAAGLLPDSCDHEGLKLQEASELLLSQLKELRSEQKELKKKMKEEKAKSKAAANCFSTACSSSSSSSSSESSDSECEREVLDMSRLKRDTSVQLPSPITINEEDVQQKLSLIIQEKAPISAYTLPESDQDCNNSLLSLLQEKKEEENNKNKIEVCMGGKCKKSGAGALLEEFQRVVGGADHAVDVIGCKCMGKCRDGPNVRLVSSSSAPYSEYFNEDEHWHHQQQVVVAASPSSVLTRSSTRRTQRSSHPLCIGVGLEDVGFIVSKLVGDTS